MDHIDMPADRDALDISIPYLVTSDTAYDRKGFFDFPARKGFQGGQSHSVTFSELQNKSPSFGVSFVQAWLYFGLLQEVFGDQYNATDFISIDGDAFKVCTKQLPDYVDRKYGELQSEGQVGVTQEEVRITKLVQRALHHCDEVDQHWTFDYWSEVLLSIRLLIASLKPICGLKQSGVSEPDNAASLAMIRSHMLQDNKWCIHHIRNLCEDTSTATVLFLANLRRHARPNADHGRCWAHERCVAFNSGGDVIEMQHLEADCPCSFVQAPVGDMLTILEKGGVPVLKYRRRRDGVPELQYVHAMPNANYAAISHLWADGLGNKRDNCMLQCQLDVLAAKVSEANRFLAGKRRRQKSAQRYAKGTVYFWIDVYCVPVAAPTLATADREANDAPGMDDPSEVRCRRLKMTAISRMTATYSWAKYVLVLDYELMQRSFKQSLHDATAHVAVSGWNSRYWTYQEYCLGKFVVFQGRDGPMSPWAPRFQRKSDIEGQHSNILQLVRWADLMVLSHLPELGSRHVELNDFWRKSTKPAHTWWRENRIRNSTNNRIPLSVIWNNLRRKTTTEPDDALCIMANLVGLSAVEVMRQPRKVHMKFILATFKHLPVDILFADTMRQLDCPLEWYGECPPAERWVPTNIASGPISDQQNVYYDSHYLYMRPTQHEGSTMTKSFGQDVRVFKVSRPKDFAARFLVPLSTSSDRTPGWASGAQYAEVTMGRMGKYGLLPQNGDLIMILEVERMFRTRRDALCQHRGACLAITSEDQHRLGRYQSGKTIKTHFVCSIIWRPHILASTSAGGTELEVLQSVSVTDDTLSISCVNNDTWPRLTIRRDLVNKPVYGREKWIGRIGGGLMGLGLCAGTVYMFSPYWDGKMHWWIVPMEIVLYLLNFIVVIMIFVGEAIVCDLTNKARQYLVLMAGQSGSWGYHDLASGDGNWSERIGTILPELTAPLTSVQNRITLCLLHAVFWMMRPRS